MKKKQAVVWTSEKKACKATTGALASRKSEGEGDDKSMANLLSEMTSSRERNLKPCYDN